MSHQCACGEPIADTAVIGARCVSQLMQDLAEIPALSDELDTVLSRQTASGRHEAGKSPEKPLPYDVGASEALSLLRSRLVGWALVLDYGELASDIDTPNLARWMLARIERIKHHEAGGDIADEIRIAVRNAQRKVQGSKYRAKVKVGNCPENYADTGQCPGVISALVPWDQTKTATMQCNLCPAEWPTDEWLFASRRILGMTG